MNTSTGWLKCNKMDNAYVVYVPSPHFIMLYACKKGLRKFFDVPLCATDIDIYLSREATSNTLPIERKRYGSVYIDGKYTLIPYGLVDWLRDALEAGYNNVGVWYK